MDTPETFTKIINGDQTTIANWLEERAPSYRTNPVYQRIVKGLKDDNAEAVSADKVFAYLTWVQLHNSGIMDSGNATETGRADD